MISMNHINMIRKSLTFEVSDGIGYFFWDKKYVFILYKYIL
ncbi:hypothetical protein HMPREF9700_01578 [Bergeyella zoohelcum CCUG 30536]|nr:hypothetical protein HMPREF9700_01578 [Bergeyella zoohelcum CCUG 30536]